ncbi:solute carrier family 22 member 15-like isoform X2 [Tigriopus californicus]|uniref:solute carrier family 22 member 15-like isoform X2 n=1 Tax=Tigriopus californicus TaxID=6832 RepID=UPI0027DA434F|nr:solute carrier family 22 member 15-like isoform X2 [Tigriopus californicus]
MVTFMPTFLGFTILWFIVGVSCIAVFTVGFVWSLELAAQDSKIVVTLMTGIIFSLGLLLGISFAYWVRDYRAYHQVFAGLHLITPILLILIPESPRWLVSQKKTEKLEEAICTLTKIAKSKKLQFDPISFKCGELTKHAISDDVDHFSFILTKPLLRTRAFTMFFCWITVAFVLYSISMNMKSLTGSLFLNMALTGIFGFMGKIAGFLILAKFLTRKYPFIIMFLITAVTCGLCSTLDPLDPTQRSVLSGLVVLTIMCLSCIFSIIWLYTAEMYPTAIRNFGVGSSSLMGRIGGAGCAFIAYLIEIHPGLPFMVFSGMCLIAGCLACSLPETGTLPPPSSMKEIEQRER